MASFGEYKARMQRLTATEYSWGSGYSGTGRSEVTKVTLTIPHDFNFATGKRSSYHKKVLDPMRKARQDQRERQQAEALKKKKREENKAIAEYRRSLVHQPRPVPSFSKPFRPTYGSATPPLRARTSSRAANERTQSATPRMGYKMSPSSSACDSPPLSNRNVGLPPSQLS